jgi:hypothetical protein
MSNNHGSMRSYKFADQPYGLWLRSNAAIADTAEVVADFQGAYRRRERAGAK